MTTDRIIELARKNLSLSQGTHCGYYFSADEKQIESFAQAIRRETLEEAAKVLDKHEADASKEYNGHGHAENQCSSYFEGYRDCADVCAAAIREIK